ncbi:hypothetical protein GLYMA_13G356800v4 [Glycine max]|uniref:Uncharacterized protein n=2 Tax=Glycine subgen. Soja TaxID=1462606 RepID=A0A0R0HBX5_SOYBN|nr:hypothetical protein GYH30_038403 [Glycine max]KRH23428.1 hypothetical protein GLYMA_13G356800v4 [Glycine max]RZB84604.1 Protein PLANT CADMIUM RESISTANCE 8 [Glycine soja]
MQATEDQKIQQNEPIGLIAPSYEADTIPQIGNPWSTGLFDCHENQTNDGSLMGQSSIAEVQDGGELSCHLGSFIYLLMMPACALNGLWGQSTG